MILHTFLFVPLVIFTLPHVFFRFNLCVVYGRYKREWILYVVNVKKSFKIVQKFDIISMIPYNDARFKRYYKSGSDKMTIAICDDEYITAEYYYGQIEQIFKECSAECEIDLFTDSGKLLTALYEGKRWDICFLDIDMPLINGLSLGQKLRELDMNCYLIYVSIHRECVYESFKARPFRFIPKDEFPSQISGCIADILADCRTESEQDYVTFENRTSMYRYRIDDILYIQSIDKYVTIFLKDDQQSEALRFKMSDMEQKLIPYGFIRIHKSYLVNYRYIKNIQPTCVVLDNKKQLPVSRYRLDDIKIEFRRLTL